ncbi:MAG: hypothetical protein AB1773_10220 [Pseudomonadota bacterium]
MRADELLAETELPGGGRLALYPGRLVHTGAAGSETVALAHLASVRIAFGAAERSFSARGRDAALAAFAEALADRLGELAHRS